MKDFDRLLDTTFAKKGRSEGAFSDEVREHLVSLVETRESGTFYVFLKWPAEFGDVQTTNVRQGRMHEYVVKTIGKNLGTLERYPGLKTIVTFAAGRDRMSRMQNKGKPVLRVRVDYERELGDRSAPPDWDEQWRNGLKRVPEVVSIKG